MSQIVEEPEDYENQEDNHTTNSTTNGGSDWRGNPYPSRPSDVLTGAQGFTIKRGNFEAKDGCKVGDKTRQFDIHGGKFISSGHSYDLQPSEMFANSSGHIIRDGDFTAVEGSRMFANAKDYVIEDGNFVASNSTSQVPTHYQAPVNYGTAQGNSPPRSYQGQQGNASRPLSIGYVGNPPHISNQFRQTSRPPVMQSRSATLDRPLFTDTGSNPIPTAPIPPSHLEGQSYFANRGETRSNSGDGGRKA